LKTSKNLNHHFLQTFYTNRIFFKPPFAVFMIFKDFFNKKRSQFLKTDSRFGVIVNGLKPYKLLQNAGLSFLYLR